MAFMTSAQSKLFIGVGAVLGAFIGFLLRPSVFLAGKLPFSTVITRGSNLRGLDELLVPTAQTSFNYLIVGAMVGALAGAAAAWAAPRAQSRSARTEIECPHCAERILAQAKVCKHCGRDVAGTA
jgi:hypothetical protein